MSDTTAPYSRIRQSSTTLLTRICRPSTFYPALCRWLPGSTYRWGQMSIREILTKTVELNFPGFWLDAISWAFAVVCVERDSETAFVAITFIYCQGISLYNVFYWTEACPVETSTFDINPMRFKLVRCGNEHPYKQHSTHVTSKLSHMSFKPCHPYCSWFWLHRRSK